MSNEELVKVNCHHYGQFKTTNGLADYVDGVMDVLEVDPDTIFAEVILKLLEKRIDIGRMWYKLPFEDLGDKHLLWENVDANKKKMQSTGRWMRQLDVYVEKPIDEELQIVIGQTVPEENESDGESDPAYEPEGEDDMSDDEANDEEDLSDNAESADEDEVVEEDIELVNHDNYEDEIPDGDDVYPATDDSSGDEEEQAERLVQRNLPDGVFSLKEIFSSGQEFKQNVIRYILKTRRNVVFDRWEKERLGAKCNEKGCGWHIYCAIENPIGKWMVKTFYDEHQCNPVGRCKQIKSLVIADLFVEDIRRDPEMSAPEIKDEMKRRYNIIITPTQSQSARRRAFNKLQNECNEQFARLRDYQYQLTKTMEGSTVEINTTTRPDGTDEF